MKLHFCAAAAAVLLVGTTAHAAGNLRLGINSSDPITLDPNASIQLFTPTTTTQRRFRMELDQPVLCTSFATTTTDVAVEMVDPQGFAHYPPLRGLSSITYQINDNQNRGFVRLSSIGSAQGENVLACCILTPAINAACLQGSKIQAPVVPIELFANGFENFVPLTGPDLVVSVQAPATVAPGAVLVYTIRIDNEGPTAATSARVREYFNLLAANPPALTSGSWTCAASGAGSSCASSSGGGLISAVGEQQFNVGIGGSVSFTVTRTVIANPMPIQGSQLRLQAAAFSRPADNESRTGNNQGEALVTILNNSSPTISDVANQTINEDTDTGALPFSVGDAETPAASLIVSASSSNTALIPNQLANLQLGGSGANRSITVTPAQDAVGSSVITLTVTDGGGATASDTFTVTVNQVNDPPSMTLGADQVLPSGSSSGARLVQPWGSNVSYCPPGRPTCVANEAGQTTTISAINIEDPNGILSGPISFTTGGDLIFGLTDAGGNVAPNGVACFQVRITDSGSNTPPNANNGVMGTVKIEVGNGSGSCPANRPKSEG